MYANTSYGIGVYYYENWSSSSYTFSSFGAQSFFFELTLSLLSPVDLCGGFETSCAPCLPGTRQDLKLGGGLLSSEVKK